jgi:hypothetical protein
MRSMPRAPCEPLDAVEYNALAAALGDRPETVHSVHVLRRRTCKAYVAGDVAHFQGAIVQADALPTEPTGFGSAPEVLWQLLHLMEGWTCVLVDARCAAALGRIVETRLGVPVRYLDDISYALTGPAKVFHSGAVRRLSLADLEMLEAAPPELRAGLWNSPREVLMEGIIACAVISGKIVATALTTAHSDRYADVGVFTQEGFRGRGYATAAASIVAQGVQEDGHIPVWSAGEHNAASLRLAQKLGFTEVSRRRYVILAEPAEVQAELERLCENSTRYCVLNSGNAV